MNVALHGHGAVHHRPRVTGQGVEVPLGRLDGSGLGAVRQGHIHVAVGHAKRQIQALPRSEKQLGFKAQTLSVRGADHIGRQTDNGERLKILVVVVVARDIKPRQAAHQGGLEAHLKGVQLFLRELELRVEVIQIKRYFLRPHQDRYGVERRVVAAAFHPPVPAGVAQQVVIGAPVQLHLGGPQPFLVLAIVSAAGQAQELPDCHEDIRVAVALNAAIPGKGDHIADIVEVDLLVDPAEAAYQGELVAELILHLPEQGPGIFFLLIGVVQADVGAVRHAEQARRQRRVVGAKPEIDEVLRSHGVAASAGRVRAQARNLRAIGVGDVDVQVIEPRHPLGFAGFPVQPDLRGPLLGVGVEEKVEVREWARV